VRFIYITPQLAPSSQTEPEYSLGHGSIPTSRTLACSNTDVCRPSLPILMVSTYVIYVNTWIMLLIYRPRMDGRLSKLSWLPHSGQFTHKVVAIRP